MKFSLKYRINKLGMIDTILGSFCSFFNLEGADIRPQIRPMKIPDMKLTSSHKSMVRNENNLVEMVTRLPSTNSAKTYLIR